jgi:hypothetical protein
MLGIRVTGTCVAYYFFPLRGELIQCVREGWPTSKARNLQPTIVRCFSPEGMNLQNISPEAKPKEPLRLAYHTTRIASIRDPNKAGFDLTMPLQRKIAFETLDILLQACSAAKSDA